MSVPAGMLIIWAVTAASPTGYQWYEDGKPIADNSWRKAWGRYGAMLHLTDKPDELFEAWEKPGARVPVSVTELAERGKLIVGVLLFTGCAATAPGNCDVQAAFQVFKPDGSLYGEEEEAVFWNWQPPTEGQLQLGEGAIGVRIEPQDPTGTYSVRAAPRCRVWCGSRIDADISCRARQAREQTIARCLLRIASCDSRRQRRITTACRRGRAAAP